MAGAEINEMFEQASQECENLTKEVTNATEEVEELTEQVDDLGERAVKEYTTPRRRSASWSIVSRRPRTG